MKILITGDLVVNQLYDSSNIKPNIIELFNQSDANIVNIEAPITSSTSKILKTGPHLKAQEQSTLDVMKSLRVDVVTLANNHLLDYDEKGVEDTLAFFKKNGIQTVGAGMNLKEASKTVYIETKEGRIALVNFAENEWASATDYSAGANPMSIIDNANQIKKAKESANCVFVIIHGGHEYYNLPSPRMQKQYRFYAEQGADIVIGHHTHCISGYEVYNDVPIYYSLGNFLFTKPSTYEDWYTGLVLEIEIIHNKIIPKLHYVKQQKETFQLEMIKGKNKEEVLNRISSYNEIINDETKLIQEWNAFVDSKFNNYLYYWSPLSFIKNRYIKRICKKFGIKMINKEGMALALIYMRCEAHSDISKEVINKYLLK